MNLVEGFWKPVGLTSFDVIRTLKVFLNHVKMGHTGTLDPFAEGVLIICFGKATSQVENLMNLKKTYVGTIQLGKTTDTLDPEGKILKTCPIPEITGDKIETVLSEFTGEICQIPPMFSALKKKGVPFYKLARKGRFITPLPRKVQIYKSQLIAFSRDILTIKVECGRGTYIRSLANDISKALGTVGYLTKLVRTQVGEYDESQSVKLKNIPQWLSTIE